MLLLLFLSEMPVTLQGHFSKHQANRHFHEDASVVSSDGVCDEQATCDDYQNDTAQYLYKIRTSFPHVFKELDRNKLYLVLNSIK